MFGHQFAKPYHHQHGICAEVICHLCLHGNPSEINDIQYVLILVYIHPCICIGVLYIFSNNNNNMVVH